MPASTAALYSRDKVLQPPRRDADQSGQLRNRAGAMQRAARLGQQRIGRLRMAAAGRSVPDRLVEYDGGAERIGQAGHDIGQIDAAEPLVGEAAAVGVDHDARGRDLVGIGPRPQPVGIHRVAAVQMAVERGEAGARGADRLRHAQAIAGRGAAVARQKFFGRRAICARGSCRQLA